MSDYVILGGGPAGLAFAYYAIKNGHKVQLLEKNMALGGNALTFNENGFLYDSGAHRWHNIYPDITTDVQEILGGRLRKIISPSSIFYRSVEVSFPITPWNLVTNVPLSDCFSMAASYLKRKSHGHHPDTFASYAQNKYGEKIVEAFLWNYTKKLWGECPTRLSREVAGKRLKGLNLKAFVSKHSEHLDGAFYYPDLGIGMIFDKIKEMVPHSSIFTGCEIESISVTGEKITSIKTDAHTFDTSGSTVISTLAPLTMKKLTGEAGQFENLQFRNLILIFLQINRPQVFRYASVYFPDGDVPYTRVVEPKNRSIHMSPENLTSLVIEWPCQGGNGTWTKSDESLLSEVLPWAQATFSLEPSEILQRKVHRLQQAYPVLTLAALADRKAYMESMEKIKNLRLIGRNATFSYLHLHDLFRSSRDYFRAVGS